MQSHDTLNFLTFQDPKKCEYKLNGQFLVIGEIGVQGFSQNFAVHLVVKWQLTSLA